MKLSVRRRRPRPAQANPKQVAERREALKTIAKFGLYTPPMLLALLNRAHAATLCSGRPCA